MRWLFSKTYQHKCPDGSVKVVFKNVDDAFPLFIPGWKGEVAADVKTSEIAIAQLKAEYTSSIHGLFVSISEFNESLMLMFRGAYLAYTTDPCTDNGTFQRQVDQMLNDQRVLQMVRVEFRALMQFAAAKQPNHEKIMEAFQNIVQQLRIGPAVAVAATAEISDNRERMNKLIANRS